MLRPHPTYRRSGAFALPEITLLWVNIQYEVTQDFPNADRKESRRRPQPARGLFPARNIGFG